MTPVRRPREDVRRHAAVRERLGRLARRVDERRVPRAARPGVADDLRERRTGLAEPLAQALGRALPPLRHRPALDRGRPHLLAPDKPLEHRADRLFLHVERLRGRVRWEFLGGVEQAAREPQVMFQQAIREVHRLAPLSAGDEQCPRRVEVDAVR